MNEQRSRSKLLITQVKGSAFKHCQERLISGQNAHKVACENSLRYTSAGGAVSKTFKIALMISRPTPLDPRPPQNRVKL